MNTASLELTRELKRFYPRDAGRLGQAFPVLLGMEANFVQNSTPLLQKMRSGTYYMKDRLSDDFERFEVAPKARMTRS